MIEFLRQDEWVVLGYLANAVWQVPVVFVAAWIATKLARRAGAAVEHRVWVLALLLEIGLPAVRFDVRAALSWVAELFAVPGGHGGTVGVVVAAGAVHGDGLRLPGALLAGIAVAFIAVTVYFAMRLAWGVWRTERMRRLAVPLELEGEAAACWRRCGAESVEVKASGMISGPVTVGVLRPVVLVPAGFLEGVQGEDFEAVIAHEMAHVRRRDFAKNLVYEAVSVVGAWHPMVWMTRARLAESREMVCDEAAAGAVSGRDRYARSLLRLAAMVADGGQARTLHAIGIFDANSFERRVMNLTKRHVEMKLVQRIGTVAACAVMVLASCATAMALRVEVGPEMEAVAAASGTDPVKVDADKVQATYKKPPVYPVEAKKNKNTLDGPVVLAVVIGKDGAVQQIKVKKSLREDYDRSALEAVKDWRWQPFLLNGEPVEVDTTVTVTYSLAPEGKDEPKTKADASGGWDTAPKIIEASDAAYPAEVRSNKNTLDGAVVVGLTVGTDGVPRDTRIVSSLRADYDESALKAVKQYRFSPAIADGRPVDAKIQVQVDFRMY